MEQLFIGVNWLAVGLGTLLSYLLGAVWFSPAWFGERWAAGTRASLGKEGQYPWMALVLQLLGTFLLAWLIGLASANNSWPSALLIVLAVLVLMVAGFMLAGHSHYATLVQGGYLAVMALLIVLCVGLLG